MDWQAVSSTLSSIATIIGWGVIIGGAWWFRKRRLTYPRANYTHRIEHYQIDGRYTLVRVSVVIENKGEVLIKLADGCVRIYQVKPWPRASLLDSLSEGKRHIKEGQNEIDWTMIAKQDLQLPTGTIEVEPGEITEIPFDFVIDSSVEIAIVYSYVRNSHKARRDIGWDKSTTYVLPEHSSPDANSKKEPNMGTNSNSTNGNEKMVQTTDTTTQRGQKPEQQPAPPAGAGKGSKPPSANKSTR